MSKLTMDTPTPAGREAMPSAADFHDALADLDVRTEPDDETRVFATLLSLIGGEFDGGRIALAVTAALDSRVSVECALAVLDRYTGPKFGDHYWSAGEGNQRRRLYRLIPG
ncbi:MAG: hypothetical protein B7Y86_11200 [Brevundimonas subvibrioides]|uniref:Uncharacterized protein n=1 Tax=Brevundimonas subvibrioides TaxID=74313 RepID=A0A258HHE1_9CAUL|nr:hypothetical protein [Brevundimonas subvibrioides]OYX56007.1 MAG: hypothetical protein B7Y86_11200 [Brevundimonas subvibrioides]